MSLKPILRPGATSNADLALATARDFIGVQVAHAPGNRGINRHAEWTQDVAEWADVQHDRNGIHSTIRIPRAVIWIHFPYIAGQTPQQRYSVDPQSYVMGEFVADNPSLVQLTVVGNGVVDVTLGRPLPHADYGLLDLCTAESWMTPDGDEGWMRQWVHCEPDTTTRFRLYRGSPLPLGNDGHHGPMAFALVA